MAKNISMTRERKIALPVILAFAQKAVDDAATKGTHRLRDLEKALEAFK